MDPPREGAAQILRGLYARLEQGKPVEMAEVEAALRMGTEPENAGLSPAEQLEMFQKGPIELRTRKKTVEPRTEAQKDYVRNLFANELAFGIGPAGTGKTYLAVTKAVEAVPAVERALVDLKAGEVTIEGSADERAVRQAIEDAGYDVRNAA